MVSSGAAKYAIYPAPSSEFYQSWYDFYPLYAAETGGKELVENGKATFDSPAGQAVAAFWQQLYAENLAGKETYNGDPFADGTSAMAIVGPWAIATYKGKVDWGVVPVPTTKGSHADQVPTFSDAKNVAMYASCKNRGTAWDFLKFSTSATEDGKLLDMTGQMPMRQGMQQLYAPYFKANPAYTGVRGGGSPRDRGAQRGELDRDLAGLPRCVVEVGHLRPGKPRHGAGRRRHADQQARRRATAR